MTFTEVLTSARRLVGDQNSVYSTADITDSANMALNRIVGIIRESEGRWTWDDSNNSDFPIATSSLVVNQKDYALDANHYIIERIEVLDQAGNWSKLVPIDQSDLFNQSITDFLKGSGDPKFYDKIGNSIFLYPSPNYSLDNSIKVFYKRGPSYFSVSDTTKSIGFNPLYHRLIPLWCAYDYALINRMPIAKDLRAEIIDMEDNLRTFYSLRDKDEHVRLKARVNNYR